MRVPGPGGDGAPDRRPTEYLDVDAGRDGRVECARSSSLPTSAVTGVSPSARPSSSPATWLPTPRPPAVGWRSAGHRRGAGGRVGVRSRSSLPQPCAECQQDHRHTKSERLHPVAGDRAVADPRLVLHRNLDEQHTPAYTWSIISKPNALSLRRKSGWSWSIAARDSTRNVQPTSDRCTELNSTMASLATAQFPQRRNGPCWRRAR